MARPKKKPAEARGGMFRAVLEFGSDFGEGGASGETVAGKELPQKSPPSSEGNLSAKSPHHLNHAKMKIELANLINKPDHQHVATIDADNNSLGDKTHGRKATRQASNLRGGAPRVHPLAPSNHSGRISNAVYGNFV